MESNYQYDLFDRLPIMKSKSPAVKWVKEWVPQEVAATGGKCMLLRWVKEDTLKALKEKEKEPAAPEPEPEPTTEVLHLCNYEGCGKTFIDAGAMRKHTLIHGERQYLCHYEGCGKKFLDSSKLKRHFLIHTGQKDFVCPHEDCGKAFSLDFNLRSHMKTHSKENYQMCPYPDCGKGYAYKYKLKDHIASHHAKNASVDVNSTTPPENQIKATKPSGGTCSSASFDRPYACPYEGCEKAYIHEYKLKLHQKKEHAGHSPYACSYEGCEKAYIHEYKLKLHLKKEHPGHMSDEIAENPPQANADHEMDEASDQDAYDGKRANGKSHKQRKSKPNLKLPPPKIAQRKGSNPSPARLNVIREPSPLEDETYEEEDCDHVKDGLRFAGNNEDDGEETEYKD